MTAKLAANALQKSITKREIKGRIYLSGVKPDYQVNHYMPGKHFAFRVPNVDIGNTIVQALRERALEVRNHAQKASI